MAEIIDNHENFTNYLIRKGLANKSIELYMSYYSKFEKNNADLEQTINDFLSRYNNDVAKAFLTAWLEFKHNRDIIIPKRRSAKHRRILTPMSKAEYELLKEIMYQRNNKYGLMLELTYECGLRRDELISITARSFNTEKWGEDISEPCELKIKGKGNKERIMLLPGDLMERISEYIFERDKIVNVYNEDANFWGMNANRWWKILRIVSKTALTRTINPHLIRHTKASDLKKAGFDIVDIKNFLGHSSIITTQLYIHSSEDETLEKMREFIKSQKV